MLYRSHFQVPFVNEKRSICNPGANGLCRYLFEAERDKAKTARRLRPRYHLTSTNIDNIQKANQDVSLQFRGASSISFPSPSVLTLLPRMSILSRRPPRTKSENFPLSTDQEARVPATSLVLSAVTHCQQRHRSPSITNSLLRQKHQVNAWLACWMSTLFASFRLSHCYICMSNSVFVVHPMELSFFSFFSSGINPQSGQQARANLFRLQFSFHGSHLICSTEASNHRRNPYINQSIDEGDGSHCPRSAGFARRHLSHFA
ncbi:hypothetical protein IW262DRAFT_216383 [Armillaria fumosa]|nr:hypothetical protein IW262DRAFT_216383 [Armillaria fumosa]